MKSGIGLSICGLIRAFLSCCLYRIHDFSFSGFSRNNPSLKGKQDSEISKEREKETGDAPGVVMLDCG